MHVCTLVMQEHVSFATHLLDAVQGWNAVLLPQTRNNGEWHLLFADVGHTANAVVWQVLGAHLGGHVQVPCARERTMHLQHATRGGHMVVSSVHSNTTRCLRLQY